MSRPGASVSVQQPCLAKGQGHRSVPWAVGLLLVCSLSACTTAQVDQIPTSVGGLPAGAPARPETPPAFPAVHDMPPPRSQALLDEEQQKRLEQELIRARDRQAPEQAKKAAQAKKKAEQAKKPQNTGQKPNP